MSNAANERPPVKALATLAACAVAALLLGGCAQQYLARSDRIMPTAGDAVQANIVTHVIDPWPQASRSAAIVIPAGRLPKTTTREEPKAQPTRSGFSILAPSGTQ